MKIIICISLILIFNLLTISVSIKTKYRNSYDDPLAIDSKVFSDAFSNSDDFQNVPGFLQNSESEKDDDDDSDGGYIKSNRRRNAMKNTSSNIYKRKQSEVMKLTDLPGYIDPNSNIYRPRTSMRFAQQDDDYFNPNQKNADPNSPGKELEMIRQEGLSNGIVLSNNKRTANIETGEYLDMYLDLTKE